MIHIITEYSSHMHFFLVTHFKTQSVVLKVAVSVGIPFLKPYCSLISLLFVCRCCEFHDSHNHRIFLPHAYFLVTHFKTQSVVLKVAVSVGIPFLKPYRSLISLLFVCRCCEFHESHNHRIFLPHAFFW